MKLSEIIKAYFLKIYTDNKNVWNIRITFLKNFFYSSLEESIFYYVEKFILIFIGPYDSFI